MASIKSSFSVRKSSRRSKTYSSKNNEEDSDTAKVVLTNTDVATHHSRAVVMASIKSSFSVRKSSCRSKTYSSKNNEEDSDTAKVVLTNTDVATHHSRENSDSSQSLSSKSNLTRSPVSSKSLHFTTPSSLVRQTSLKQRSRIFNEGLTSVREQFLSPTKRKSDEKNECSISPCKSSRSSVSGLPPKICSFLSASMLHSSPAGLATPVSVKHDSRRSSRGSTGIPRRLFGSPENCNSKTPIKASLTKSSESFSTPDNTYLKSDISQLSRSRGSTGIPRRLFDSPENCKTPDKASLAQLPESFFTPDNTHLKSYNSQLSRSKAKPYLSAKRCLHTAKPDRLIGRDNEASEIEDFICDKVDNNCGGSMYISGPPGTGKTAVVNYVVEKLKIQFGCLKTAFVNCMTLKDSNTVFSLVHEQLTGSAIKTKEATGALQDLFSNCDDSMLLVLDEIDQLESKHHHVLYSIFEWPALEGSKLILIGVANALDLTDRVLPRLQTSKKCRPTLMNFAPYTSVQITEILKHRLERDNTVEPSALNFCARKVAAVAGDVRKALNVCRRAVEMVEADVHGQQVLKVTDCNSPTKQLQGTPLKKVTLVHISKVMLEVYGSSVTAASNSDSAIPLQQKLAVCSLLVLVKSSKIKEVQMGKLHEVYTKVCKRQHMTPVDQSEFYSILSLLDARGIIGMKKAKETRLTKVSLKIDEQELEQTLQDKVLIAVILKDGVPK